MPQRLPFNRVAQFDFENSLIESLGRFSAARPPPAIASGIRARWDSTPGHDGQALSLNGASGVRLPTGLITNYEYTVSFWINPRVHHALHDGVLRRCQ